MLLNEDLNDKIDKFYKCLGLMMKAERLAQNLTLEQVASEVGLTAKGLQRYETGERKINLFMLFQIGSALDINTIGLLTDMQLFHSQLCEN